MNNILSQQPLSTSLILHSDQSSDISIEILQELKDSVQLMQLPIPTDSSEPILQTQIQLQQLDELKQHNQQFIQQIKDLHITISELNQTIYSQDIQIKQHKTQIDKFQLIIKDNNHSIQQLKQTISDFEYKVFEKEEIINEINDQINKLKSQKLQLQQSVSEYKSQLHLIKQEKTELLLNHGIITQDKLQSQNEQHLQKEIQQLHQDYNYLLEEQEQQEQSYQKQIQELKEQCKICKQQNDELLQFKDKFNLISDQINDTKLQIINYENLITKLEDSNRNLQDKNAELQKKLSKQQLNTNEIKQKYHDLILLHENDQTILVQQQNQITLLKKDLGRFKYQRDSLIEVQTKLMKSQYIEDDTNFKKQLDTRQVEIHSLKDELSTLQNNLKSQQDQYKQLQQNFLQFDKEAQNIIQQLNSEIIILHQYEELYEQLQLKNSQYIQKIETLEVEIQDQKKQNQQLCQEIKQMAVVKPQFNFQNTQTEYQIRNQYQQTDSEQELKSVNRDKLVDIENTISYIINNLDQLKDTININQSNIKDLLNFKQVMSQIILQQQSDTIQENDYIQQSTQLHTPRSIERKEINSNQIIENLNSQQQLLEIQLIEKKQLMEQQQEEIDKLQKQLNIMKLKETEKNLQDLMNGQKQLMKKLECENLELKVKLEAQQEISKDNMRLRKKIAQLEINEQQQCGESPIKILNNKQTVKTQLSIFTNKSIERKRTMNSEYQSYIKQQSHIDSGIGQLKKYVDILKRKIDEQNLKLAQQRDTIKQGSNLLNSLLNDLRKKQNVISNEDLTKKKSIIAFIEKLGQQTEFVLRKLNSKNEGMSPNKECF